MFLGAIHISRERLGRFLRESHMSRESPMFLRESRVSRESPMFLRESRVSREIPRFLCESRMSRESPMLLHVSACLERVGCFSVRVEYLK